MYFLSDSSSFIVTAIPREKIVRTDVRVNFLIPYPLLFSSCPGKKLRSIDNWTYKKIAIVSNENEKDDP